MSESKTALHFSTIPQNAQRHPSKFTASIPDTQLSEFKTLLRLSKLAPATYEGLQEDRKYGVTTKWLTEAKEHWEKTFDWYVLL
jgi:microsomal epoxide hydrolase